MLPNDSPTLAPMTRHDLQIRPAQPGDREVLNQIAAQIWDGHDYLPHVFDAWLNDPHGGFFVATLHDQVIGTSKVTRLAEGEWWMEGLRVDPAFHGHGYGRILHHFALNQIHQRGEGIVRFSTASVNAVVPRLAAESGFERVAVYAPYRADGLDDPVQTWRQLGSGDQARVWALLESSAYFAQAQRSYVHEWSFYLLTQARLADQLAAGLVYGWQNAGTLTGIMLVSPVYAGESGESELDVEYLDTPLDQLPAAARDVRRLAAALDCEQVRIRVLHRPEQIAAYEAANFAREWDGDVWLYARDVRLAARAEVRTETLPPVENE